MPTSDDPINDIESDHASRNIGQMGYMIYKGAKDAGASDAEATLILNAWFGSVAAASSMTGLLKELGKDEDAT